MQIYLDSANIKAIEKYASIVSGVTTNPAIMAKENATQEERLKAICSTVPTLPVSGEVVYATDIEQIVKDAKKLQAIAPNIIVKIPGNLIGFGAIPLLKQAGIKLNVTAMMTFEQLSYAAMLGADYVSIFFCRAKDVAINPIIEIEKIRHFIEMNSLKTQIIVGSLRKPSDVSEALKSRAHILTIVPELIEETFTHFNTQASIDEFAKKYEQATKK